MAKYLATKKRVLLNGKHYITCDWGYYSNGKTWHKGLDLIGDSQKSDTSADYVVAFADGRVIGYNNAMSGTTDDTTTTASMGNYVAIQHENGYITRYMHMRKGTVKVKTGDAVSEGQVIGFMGNTGNSAGRHLHFDISSDVRSDGCYKATFMGKTRYYVDPKPFLKGEKSFKPVGYPLGTYEVTSAVNVRKGASSKSERVMYKDFTASAKQQIQKLMPNKKPDEFPKGLRVTISEVSGNYGRCPSGWICLKYCKKV